MKRVLIFTFAIACAHQIMAQEGINSKVIHNYTEFFVGYQYVDDFGADHGHGVVGHSSVDMYNLLFDINGGYVWGDGADAWNAGGRPRLRGEANAKSHQHHSAFRDDLQ
jgi:hypothetical protein